jgi:hypothetical protein
MLTALVAAALAVVSPAPVDALAVAGGRVAFAAAPTARDCDRVYLWTTRSRRAVPLGAPKPCGERLSTGRGLSALALAGDRALWLTYAGGNIREWARRTATSSRPQPRLLRFVPRDVDAPSPVVVGNAGGGLLPYAVDRSVIGLRPDGSRAFAWTAPAPPLALSAGAGHVAVTLPGGRVVVLDSAAQILSDRTYDATVLEARVTTSGLVLRRSRSLGLAAATPWPLPARARLEDVQGRLAAYSVGSTLHLLRLDTGHELTLRLAAPLHAQIESGRLYLSSVRLVRERLAPAVS